MNVVFAHSKLMRAIEVIGIRVAPYRNDSRVPLADRVDAYANACGQARSSPEMPNRFGLGTRDHYKWLSCVSRPCPGVAPRQHGVQSAPERPKILPNRRWQEDWSVLSDPRTEREPLDDLKYIRFSEPRLLTAQPILHNHSSKISCWLVSSAGSSALSQLLYYWESKFFAVDVRTEPNFSFRRTLATSHIGSYTGP
jgi:hypothetical protein